MASSFARRKHAIAAVLIALSTSVTAPAFADAAADAKASLADADKASKAKDWTAAARAYDAANKASPSSAALDGLANAYYQGGDLGGAFNAYGEWIDKYGAKDAAKKKNAEARRSEILGKTGIVVLNGAEGATVTVDDKPTAGGQLRLSAGAHKLHVTKDGFSPFDATPMVAVGGVATVDVKLISANAKGKISVKEKTGKAVRVLVDNVDVGDAPWTGEAEPGQHDVGARGTGLIAAPEKVTVERGKTSEVELVASASSAPVKIGTSDNKGLIYLDGKLVGEGSFVSEVPSGLHKLKITREGYDQFEEDLTVKDKEALARTVTLKLSSKIETSAVQTTERLEGLYGGFTLGMIFTPGGTDSKLQLDCEGKGSIPTLTSCEAPDGLGGGVGGYIGYHWDPVGMELFVAGQYDQRTIKNTFATANTDPGLGPDPARNEEWHIHRAGGMAVARIRVTWQTTKLRLSVASGVGISRRTFLVDRDTTLASDANQKDTYVSASSGYWSPIVSLEPSVMYRLSSGVAVNAGLQVFFDAPSTFLSGNPNDQNPQTSAESNHRLGGRGLTTTPIDVAANMQVFVGPFIGMMFGP